MGLHGIDLPVMGHVDILRRSDYAPPATRLAGTMLIQITTTPALSMVESKLPMIVDALHNVTVEHLWTSGPTPCHPRALLCAKELSRTNDPAFWTTFFLRALRDERKRLIEKRTAALAALEQTIARYSAVGIESD